ncbi:hypothetical protein ASD42_26480 [Nocardia sp. Root136]|uniref:hypothetical protein n=1 Tax=Nocardia TaxID=1817 RepID=UPI0006FC627E|nr:hypothetical protein [Nocardia sp. Root136]KQY29044.1 hypothetical protein ASD42_26480 [Nocardia sp. Root136]
MNPVDAETVEYLTEPGTEARFVDRRGLHTETGSADHFGHVDDAVAGQLRQLRGPDADEETLIADAEVALLAVGGLAQGMLTNDDYASRATQLVDHLLDRVLGN